VRAGAARVCPRMEVGVDQIEIASVAREHESVRGTEYAPGDFLRQFGAVVAICLGLAALAHVLVVIVGAY
jgi:hypothetical protein